MRWFSHTVELVRARYAAMLLTAALALVPANLLAAGAMRFTAAAGHPESVEPQTGPAAGTKPIDQLHGREVIPGQRVTPGDLRAMFSIAFAFALGLALLFLGVALGHAALVPIVLGKARGPAEAWAVVGSRMGALFATGVPGALAIGAGLVLLVVPGLLAMIGFAFAVPVTLVEGMQGRAALDRSARLMRSRWPAVAGLGSIIVGITAASAALAMLLPPGAWRMAAATLLRTLAYPLPLAGLIVLYREARRAEAASVHAPQDSAGIVVR